MHNKCNTCELNGECDFQKQVPEGYTVENCDWFEQEKPRCPGHDVPLEYDMETGLHVCPECGYCE